jgi:type I restriction enzyme M protein
MALKKSELYSSLWAILRRTPGRHGRLPIQGLRPGLLFIKYISDKYAGKNSPPITRSPQGRASPTWRNSRARPPSATRHQQGHHRPARRRQSPALPGRLPDFNDPNKLGSGKEMVDRLTNLIAIFEKPGPRFLEEPGRGRRHPRRRLRIPHAALRHRERQEQGPVLHPGGSQPHHGPGHRHRPGRDQPGHHRLRPHLRLQLAAAEVADEATHPRHPLRSGKGLRHRRPGPDEHDPARLPHRGNQAGQHPCQPALHRRRRPQAPSTSWSPIRPSATSGGATASIPNTTPTSRFEAFGIPPAKQGDYAYLLHIIRTLKSTGKGACILPHGVLFRGNAEAAIRKKSHPRGYLKGIIGLPANLFYGTGIPACILVSTRSTPPPAKASS